MWGCYLGKHRFVFVSTTHLGLLQNFLYYYLKKNFKLMYSFPGSSAGKESTFNAGKTGDCVFSPCVGKILKEGRATHSSVLAWKIPWTKEAGGLQSKRLQHFHVYFHLALGFPVDLTKFPTHLFIRDIFLNIQHFEASFSHGGNGGFVRQMDI